MSDITNTILHNISDITNTILHNMSDIANVGSNYTTLVI